MTLSEAEVPTQVSDRVRFDLVDSLTIHCMEIGVNRKVVMARMIEDYLNENAPDWKARYKKRQAARLNALEKFPDEGNENP